MGSVSRNGIPPKLDVLEYPSGDQIIAAFFDDTTNDSTPVIRLVVAFSEDLILESDYAISKESHDFTLLSLRRDLLLVTASRFGLTVNQLDVEGRTSSVNQVIYNRSLVNVRRH